MRYSAAVVPASQHYFAPGQLQFITSSVYCRAKVFDSPRARGEFAGDDKRRASLCLIRRFSVAGAVCALLAKLVGFFCHVGAACTRSERR